MIKTQTIGQLLALALLSLSQVVLGQSIDSVCFNTAPAPFVSDSTASGADGSYSYLWQDSIASGNWASAPGTNSGLVYQPQALTEKTYFRRQVLSASCGDAYSNILTVHVYDQLDSTSTVVTDITCPGGMDGAISITVTGGLMPYSYSWSSGGSTTPTNTGLSSGSYTVSVTDSKLCDTLIYSFSVADPVPLMASTTIDSTISCFGLADGGATVLATGGTGPYSYLWSNSVTDDFITGVATGTYTVSVTDVNGCVSVLATADISQPGLLVASAVSPSFPGGSNISCKNALDGAINTTLVGGTAGFTYAWLGPNAFASTMQNLTALDSGAYTLTVADTNGCIALDTVVLSEPDSLFINLTSPQFIGGANISCFDVSDGAVNLGSTGGSPNLSYNWTGPNGFVSANQNIASVSAGAYQITATDANGCTATASIALSEPATALSVSLVSPEFIGGHEVSCYESQDGAVNTATNGGTAGYSFQWQGANGFMSTNESITGLGAGTYNLTVEDTNGCIVLNSITMDQPDTSFFTSLSALEYLGGWNINCNGTATGEITLTELGAGIPGFTYAWTGPNGFTATNPNINGLVAGEYAIATTDTNGCVALDTLVLTSPDSLMVSIDSLQDVICLGDSNGKAWASFTGGVAPIVYQWQYGANQTTFAVEDITNGTVDVTVTDAQGCTNITTASIGFMHDLPIIDLGPDVVVEVNQVFLAVADTFVTYLWSSGSPDTSITVFSNDPVWIQVTDSNGCSNTDTINISLWPTGVETLSLKYNLKIYPNPSFGSMTLETPGLEQERLIWSVYSLEGKLVNTGVFNPSSSAIRGQINLGGVAGGSYLLQVASDKASSTARIVVK